MAPLPARLGRHRRPRAPRWGSRPRRDTRQPWTSTAPKIPISPRIAIHQMCQISAKPITVAKKAMTNPIGLFFGISIGCSARLAARSGFCPLLHRPISVLAFHMRQHREIPRRRRRSRRPFERAAVPGIAGDVAALIARADADDELHDRQHDAREDDERAGETRRASAAANRSRRNAASAASRPSAPAHRAA